MILSGASGTLVSGAGRLGGMTGPGRETSAMTLPGGTHTLASLGEGVCLHADRLFRWALDVEPPTVAAAELRETALARLEEALLPIVADPRASADRREAALGSLVALAHPAARGHAAVRSLAWAAGKLMREYQRDAIAGTLHGVRVDYSLAAYPIGWLPPEAVWVERVLCGPPAFEVPIARAFGIKPGERPTFSRDELRSPPPDVDRALERPCMVMAFPGTAARLDVDQVLDDQQAWAACPLAKKERLEWLVVTIAKSVDDERSRSPRDVRRASESLDGLTPRERVVLERLRHAPGGVAEASLDAALRHAGHGSRARAVVHVLRGKGWPITNPGVGLGYRLESNPPDGLSLRTPAK